jgi:glycosyltransferase involved in cell wall biosynthesis
MNGAPEPLPVTVVIPVLNEERNLPACLASLGTAFAEVLAVDSGSGDRTAAIAAAAGVKVLDFVWDGKYPKKRNWVLQNHSFRTVWVLFLDADERVTPAFVDALRRMLPSTDCSGFWLRFNNRFLGHPLRHGDVFCKLALFRVGAGEYERFPEDHWSHLDMEIHEHPVLAGSIGCIEARLEHHDDRPYSDYVRKHEAYADWEAKRFHWLHGAGDDAWALLTPRQRFKYRHLDRWWLGMVYFLGSYVLKRGFLDGMPGYRFACFKCGYFWTIRRRILSL